MATIRSAIRDYLEATPTMCNGAFVLAMSPDDHAGNILGSSNAMARFKGGKWVYDSAGMTDAEYARYFHENASKVGWTGPVIAIPK